MDTEGSKMRVLLAENVPCILLKGMNMQDSM